jgi:AcrR family transcriptional regulator
MNPEKRAQIMSAAEALFLGGRFHEITMEDVARTAGVGKGTIYRYFKDKDDLFREVARSGHDELYRMVADVAHSGMRFDQQLVDACRRISEFFQRRRQLYHMMQAQDRQMFWSQGSSKAEWQDRRRRLVEALAGILERGKSAGLVRGDIAASSLASCLLALLWGRARELRHGSSDDALDYTDVVDVFLHGAEAPQERE